MLTKAHVTRDLISGVARDLDKNNLIEAENKLNLLVSFDNSSIETRLIIGLWHNLNQKNVEKSLITTSEFLTVNTLLDQIEQCHSGANIWGLFQVLASCDDILTPQLIAGILTSCTGGLISNQPYGFKYDVLSRIFISGSNQQFHSYFTHILKADQTYVPDFWLFQSLLRVWREEEISNVELEIENWTMACNRPELLDLLTLYLYTAVQEDTSITFKMALALKKSEHKEKYADYLLGASQLPENITKAQRLHAKLTGNAFSDQQNFMKSRAAVANGNYKAALKHTKALVNNDRLGLESICLRALAHSLKGDFSKARRACEFVINQQNAPWFLSGRAKLILAGCSQLEAAKEYPSSLTYAYLKPNSGKPLVQALWVGKRLRWIEELSMLSYLRNGWRYQLYTYDDIENIPDGVEVMDANSILSEDTVFREGSKSGIHKGSLGAFSDLFRYALLAKRGGLYSDTDVINLRKFEPEGAKFISTELSDAGIVGPNGALMAAPSKDALQVAAFEIAQKTCESGDISFAKIGPVLLAELIASGRYPNYKLLPVEFMNPISWMNTGRLLDQFDEFIQLAWLKKAHNIHVYTETWRLIGLDLKTSPKDNSFVSVLFNRLQNEKSESRKTVLELLE